jgi:hypothetical protein
MEADTADTLPEGRGWLYGCEKVTRITICDGTRD